MTQDTDLLDAWYHYAASAPGFIGTTLQIQRDKAFLTEEQQRAALGILDSKYDHFWLRLQAMLLPRPLLFASDTERIVAYLSQKLDLDAPIPLDILCQFIRTGLS
jgi:hypothetical protein